MLDAIEEPLDLVAEFIDARAEGWWIDAMAERPDIGVGATFGNFCAQGIAVVAAIGQQALFAPFGNPVYEFMT